MSGKVFVDSNVFAALLLGPSLPASAGWRTYQRQVDLVTPSPAMHWLLLDEHPDSIGDGAFGVNCQNQGSGARFVDFPAAFHNGAAGLGFAEGHAEIKRWLDSRTLAPVTYTGEMEHNVASPNNQDVAWLQARTSVKK